MSGGRKLSREDQALWNRVLRSVRPMGSPGDDRDSPPGDSDETPVGGGQPPRRLQPEKPASHAPVISAPVAPRTRRATASPYYPPVSSPKAGAAPALSPLEPRQKKRLSRGQREVDDRLDLHGMRQSTAFHMLTGFLRQAQSRDAKTVLVITGKGSADRSAGDPDYNERGVLRRLVPQWLSRREFRDLVVGFEPAARRHGGDGALYVRIRRRK